ncbi:TetR/AcrR family transcriptional regulator C-terminal domain-containing protein [Arthrobacter sp. 35W]|uniref:TetR/AcrR family transcriptional regulator C-terminal domain-containing protein n=1 Tax=Arthrobacter sp. 35W TaxID=1132441 RepID=UPI000413F3BE|nr:TetR/AcrR family transcriptional regulator C-terminal domain-containing protein [Arthrobacter sp. 35W]
MLSRAQIVDTAFGILSSYGLADLSMRRLARDLGVQPGALYWHVKNKQELLVVLAERILEPVDGSEPDVRRSAAGIRTALLKVRDGADVVALAQALDPQSLAPIQRLGTMLADGGLDARAASWGARTLAHYILGSVAEEQTQAELLRAGLLDPVEANDAGHSPDDAFLFGIDTILRGLNAP